MVTEYLVFFGSIAVSLLIGGAVVKFLLARRGAPRKGAPPVRPTRIEIRDEWEEVD
jgi:hypothetical protein